MLQKAFKVTDYFGAQRKFEPKDRATATDWLVQIQESFEYNHETMYLAVKIMDLYISQLPPNSLLKSTLQLIPCVAVFIAAKTEVSTLSVVRLLNCDLGTLRSIDRRPALFVQEHLHC